MQGPIINLVAAAGLIASLGVSAVGAQQRVTVTVNPVPNQISAGSCTRIRADVRDELNRELTLENGVPLQWGSYDYTTSNGTDFEWRNTGSEEFELCAKPGVGAVSTEVTATIKGMPYSGTARVSVGAQPPAPTANTGGAAPGGAAPGAVASATAPAAAPPAPTPTTVPAQPYTPGAASAPTAQAYSPPAQPYAPAAAPAGASPAAVAAQAPAPAPAAQPVLAQPVKSSGGFFKKMGSHFKQKAAEVKAETAQNLTAAATQVVDTTFQTGSRLVASTTAEVTNTARLGIGGVGQKLMLAPQRGGGSADNLALAIASGRAVLLELRFTPGTSVLEPSARDLVQRLGAELRKAMADMPAARFEINAHVESPTDQVLSENRAATIKALLGNQADPRRLTALGYGASQPLNGVPTARIEIVRCNDGQTKCLMEVAP
jgi:flagellar motor protein MotB